MTRRAPGLRSVRHLVVRGGGPVAGSTGKVSVEVAGVPVNFQLVRSDPPEFDAANVNHRDSVLVRVRGFSLNYRDKAIILELAHSLPEGGFFPIGSEFSAEVVAVGAAVEDLRPGHRVIGNGSYPQSDHPDAAPGVPTNSASSEMFVVHRAKVVRIPDSMSPTIAAAFSIGAQTTYSMIRKLALQPGEKVLVTAARSNTSLFALQALRGHPVDVYATTTSDLDHDRILGLGVRRVFQIDRELEDFSVHPEIAEICHRIGGFDAIIDPFADLHLGKAVTTLTYGGRYITCGVHDQYLSGTGSSTKYRGLSGPDLLRTLVLQNVSIIGNCLGRTSDLEAAIADHAAGRFDVCLDSVHSGSAIGPFLERTYSAADRYGKVVYLHPQRNSEPAE